LAVVMFLFMQFGAAYFFKFVGDPDIYQKTLEFLKYRSYGVFFSYIGLAMIALYTGVARGGIILACTVTLGIVNLVLCYGLVNGVWGLPEMGISGAGLASTIAEIVSFIMFFAYMIWDKKTERYNLLSPRMVDMALIRQQARLSSSTLAQALVSIGSWFVFFAIVERFLGQHDLAITNLVRMVYLCLSIPSWGFFTGINTIVSNIVGQAEHQGVLPVIKKTAWLTFVVTVCFAVPFTLFPTTFLEPIFRNTEHGGVLIDAIPVLRVVLLNLAMSAIGGVYFNGLSGTGATAFGVRIQILCAFLYLAYNYVVIGITHSGLAWAWLSETVYWGVMLALTLWYLRSNRWQTAQV
jgi:multidrug resistance protein, MATE family